MKLITQAIFLIAFHFTAAKQFEECEFAIELYRRHQVAREDIYKHFCIANSLHTAKDTLHGFKGIYAIGSEWWCGQDAPGGGCNVKCSDLLDDDIADDVACASLILSQQGLNGWRTSETTCKSMYEQKADDCLGAIDVLIGLTGNVQENLTSTTVAPTTTVGTTIAPTRAGKLIAPTRNTTEIPIRSSTQNSTNEDYDDIDFNSSPQQTLKMPVGCSCATQNILLSIMVVALLGATVAVFFKYRNLKRFVSFVYNKEYDEHLISSK